MKLPTGLLPLLVLIISVVATPLVNSKSSLRDLLDERAVEPGTGRIRKRTEFPDNPPSCQLCERDYDSISSCANASIVLSEPSQILFDPLSFYDVIQCACVDTFQSAYPQCVDCFTQTNQTGFLVPENGNLSSVITGMREICALGSAIFGGVASANSQLPGQTPITVPSEGAAVKLALGLKGRGGLESGVLVGLTSIVLGVVMGVWTVL